jgi:UPF0042 nucleotide-binding protein
MNKNNNVTGKLANQNNLFSTKGKIVLITGMSGAGKSVALKTLEDIGYEAMDNIPLSILPLIIKSSKNMLLAVGIDIRNRDFTVEEFLEKVDSLQKQCDLTVMFLDCDDDVLQRRFTETRRKHPLISDTLVTDSIAHERDIIGKLRHRADLIIDTSHLNSLQLKQLVIDHIAGKSCNAMSIAITSFSYKGGLPREADLVFDVRFLKNPFYEDKLKPLTGAATEIAKFIENDPNFPLFFKQLTELLLYLLPLYCTEGKQYLTIAIGCTGGQHRSVAVAEKLNDFLSQHQYQAKLFHREL